MKLDEEQKDARRLGYGGAPEFHRLRAGGLGTHPGLQGGHVSLQADKGACLGGGQVGEGAG